MLSTLPFLFILYANVNDLLFVRFVKSTVVCASSVISAFLVHSECIPCCRAEDLVFRYVMHSNRNTEHRCECNKICTNVSVGNCTVVSSPVVHYIVSGLKCAFFAVASRSGISERTMYTAMYSLYVSTVCQIHLPEVLLSILLQSEASVQGPLQGSDGSL